MSSSPKARRDENNHKILPEVTGWEWSLAFHHPVATPETAQKVEQSVIAAFRDLQLDSNGEVLDGADTMAVQLMIIENARLLEKSE